MKRILTVLYLISALLIISCSGGKVENELKVMTINIRSDNPSDSINVWDSRAGIITSLLKDQLPDVIGMQEVMAHQYNYLDSFLTDFGSVGVGSIDGSKGGEMNPVFYRKDRFDLVRTITFWLSETPYAEGSISWGSDSPHTVTWIELADKNTHKHIYCFNTRFDDKSDSSRTMSSKLLLEKVDSIAREFPFIITGDFNMLPDEKGISVLTGPYESVPLLRDAHNISVKRPFGPTYTFNGFADRVNNGRIDYIFVKDGIKVLEHKTLIKKEKGIYISDHWPVMAVIELEE